MKRVLIVTYYFPPAGGSGVHRPSAWARHLREFGYEPVVLTPGPEWHTSGATELQSLAGEQAEVARTSPDRWSGIARFVRARMPMNLNGVARVFDPSGLWAMSAIRAGDRIMRRKAFDAILTTAPPYMLGLVGDTLSRRHGVPWVMDLRSPWAEALAVPWVGGVGYFFDRWVERRFCSRAKAVTFHDNGGLKRTLRVMPFLARKPIRWLPGGFIPTHHKNDCVKRDGKLRLVHVGVFYWNSARDRKTARKGWKIPLPLKYSPDDVDLSRQSAGFLLRAVKCAVDIEPKLKEQLRIVLVGQLHPSDEGLAKKLGIENMVDAVGQVPHAEAARYMGMADVLYLPFWFSRRCGKVIRSPSKLFEYMGAGKPILAVMGPGDPQEILHRSGAGIWCSEPTENGLAKEILRLCEQPSTGGVGISPSQAYTERFRWDRLVGEMAQVLDEVTSQRASDSRMAQPREAEAPI